MPASEKSNRAFAMLSSTFSRPTAAKTGTARLVFDWGWRCAPPRTASRKRIPSGSDDYG
jgi:hypothetical protein